jgi:hypothetical protein
MAHTFSVAVIVAEWGMIRRRWFDAADSTLAGSTPKNGKI